MARAADVDVVQGHERLAVVEARLDHRALRHQGSTAGDRDDLRTGLLRRERHQNAGVDPRLGIDAEHGLALQVLRDVRDQTVLTDHDDHVLRGEQILVQVGPLHDRLPERGRHRVRHDGEGGLDRVVSPLDGGDASAAGAEEELRLPVGGVPVDESSSSDRRWTMTIRGASATASVLRRLRRRAQLCQRLRQYVRSQVQRADAPRGR